MTVDCVSLCLHINCAAHTGLVRYVETWRTIRCWCLEMQLLLLCQPVLELQGAQTPLDSEDTLD